MIRKTLLAVSFAIASVILLSFGALATAVYEESFTGQADNCISASGASGWEVYAGTVACIWEDTDSAYFNPTSPSYHVRPTTPQSTDPGTTSPEISFSDSSFTVGWYTTFNQLETDVQPRFFVTSSNSSGSAAESGANIGVRVAWNVTPALYEVQVWDSSTGWEFTGYSVSADSWYQFRVAVDNVSRTYDVWFDADQVADDVEMPATGNNLYFHAGFDNTLTTWNTVRMWVDWISVDVPSITSTPDGTASPGASYTYQITHDGSGEVTYSISGASWLSVDSNGLATGTAVAGTYTVNAGVTNSAGTTTQSYTLTVSGGGGWGGRPGGEAKFERLDQFPCEATSLTVMFRDATVDPRAVMIYIWDFGDGTNAKTTTNPEVAHTYAETGTYTVVYAVLTTDGTVYRAKADVNVGFCAVELTPFAPVMTGLVVTLATLWLTYVFTRRRKVMVAAAVVTVMTILAGYFYLA